MTVRQCLLLVLFIGLAGCQNAAVRETGPNPGPTLSILDAARESVLEGDRYMEQGHHEDGALKYREALVELSEAGAEAEEIRRVQDSCVLALKEAGGFCASRRLWLGVAERNPDAQVEAKRMVERAEKMMRAQSAELLQVAQEDFEARHLPVARATGRAALELRQELGDPAEQLLEVKAIITSFDEESR